MSDELIGSIEKTCKELEAKLSSLESETTDMSRSVANLELKYKSFDTVNAALAKERQRLTRETPLKRFLFASAQQKSNFD